MWERGGEGRGGEGRGGGGGDILGRLFNRINYLFSWRGPISVPTNMS